MKLITYYPTVLSLTGIIALSMCCQAAQEARMEVNDNRSFPCLLEIPNPIRRAYHLFNQDEQNRKLFECKNHPRNSRKIAFHIHEEDQTVFVLVTRKKDIACCWKAYLQEEQTQAENFQYIFCLGDRKASSSIYTGIISRLPMFSCSQEIIAQEPLDINELLKEVHSLRSKNLLTALNQIGMVAFFPEAIDTLQDGEHMQTVPQKNILHFREAKLWSRLPAITLGVEIRVPSKYKNNLEELQGLYETVQQQWVLRYDGFDNGMNEKDILTYINEQQYSWKKYWTF